MFNLQLFLSVLFYYFFNLVFKRQTETVNGTSISPFYLPFFTRPVPKGLTFGLCLYVLCLCNVYVLYCIKALCGWRGYEPSTNKQTNKQANKQTNKQTSKQTNKQINKQTASLMPTLNTNRKRHGQRAFDFRLCSKDLGLSPLPCHAAQPQSYI